MNNKEKLNLYITRLFEAMKYYEDSDMDKIEWCISVRRSITLMMHKAYNLGRDKNP